MAWRLCTSLERIEIDNREPGKVLGTLWLFGRPDPIRLDLLGNPLRDIAGAKLTIFNPNPQPGDHTDLFAEQSGVTGDMTASRKVRVFDIPEDEALRMRKRGETPPEHMSNAIYLEWYSDRNGRVVIESSDFELSISESHWIMSAAEELEQQQRNLDAIDDWMAILNKGLDDDELSAADDPLNCEPTIDQREWDEPVEKNIFNDLRPMSEFEWERQLKESDKLTDKFSRLMDEYIDHPERDSIIAQKMGWTWLEESLDTKSKLSAPLESEEGTAEFSSDYFDGVDFDNLPELTPNPETEGMDWIRRADGEVTHPLTDLAFRTAMDTWHYCHNQGLINDHPDPDLQAMLFQAQTLSAKLAGALNGLAYDTHVEAGFIVACLKRALNYFNESSAALSKVEQKKLLPNEVLHDFRKNLHEIRQEILKLMERFRSVS